MGQEGVDQVQQEMVQMTASGLTSVSDISFYVGVSALNQIQGVNTMKNEAKKLAHEEDTTDLWCAR